MENELSILDGDNGPNVLVGGGKEDNVHGHGDDDFLDPGGEGELQDGGQGSDTCLHTREDVTLGCETTPGGGGDPA
jgi:hypothetical protein